MGSQLVPQVESRTTGLPFVQRSVQATPGKPSQLLCPTPFPVTVERFKRTVRPLTLTLEGRSDGR